MPKPGRKNDHDKLCWDLLPVEPIEDIVRILTRGARKYTPENWKYVVGARDRYYAATMRHLAAWRKGHRRDKESGRSHLAHALCCLVFLLWFEKKGYPYEPNYPRNRHRSKRRDGLSDRGRQTS